jgi:hypothetical protein
MRTTQAMACCSLIAWALAQPPAQAGENSPDEATRLCDHPAVLVARNGVRADPNANFYLHPARLSWSLQRPLSEGEHPAVLVAHHSPAAAIDPNHFILAHPAGGAPTVKETAASAIR